MSYTLICSIAVIKRNFSSAPFLMLVDLTGRDQKLPTTIV